MNARAGANVSAGIEARGSCGFMGTLRHHLFGCARPDAGFGGALSSVTTALSRFNGIGGEG